MAAGWWRAEAARAVLPMRCVAGMVMSRLVPKRTRAHYCEAKAHGRRIGHHFFSIRGSCGFLSIFFQFSLCCFALVATYKESEREGPYGFGAKAFSASIRSSESASSPKPPTPGLRSPMCKSPAKRLGHGSRWLSDTRRVNVRVRARFCQCAVCRVW